MYAALHFLRCTHVNPVLQAWCLASAVGDETVAMSQGDQLHPLLLTTGWAVKGTDGLFHPHPEVSLQAGKRALALMAPELANVSWLCSRRAKATPNASLGTVSQSLSQFRPSV